MLRLKNIFKNYTSSDKAVVALKNISVSFRCAEFVSILGPSGSGKTTLLNIIGGLDKYTKGDMYIEGVSTKDFKDSDWDDYRNNRIGFVFQSYNLIPHLSVLANVDLALTLSGVSKQERKRRATEALERVGLKEVLNKLPNQLSGGQMQRVAIARALVNNPEIILADEPTGALDSKNSVQVMKILKEISKDRLVIMVTHNPDLAIQYATRIIRFNDGKIIDDSDPYIDETPLQEPVSKKIRKLPLRQRLFHHRERNKNKMSFKTALMLSMRNFFTKKARTTLTSIAASIGIFGIAIILSLSSGFQSYINQVQQDTLVIYPLTVSKDNADFTNVLNFAASSDNDGKEGDYVGLNDTISKLVASLASTSKSNDLIDFKKNLEESMKTDPKLNSAITSVIYDYGAYINIFDENNKAINPSTFISNLISEVFKIYTDSENASKDVINTLSKGISTLEGGLFSEMIDNQKLLESQYELVDGEWPWNKRLYPNLDESQKIMLIVDSSYCMPDYRMYELGLIDDVSVHDVALSIIDPNKYPLKTTKVEVDDILGKKYKALYKYEYYIENDDGTFREKTPEELNATLSNVNEGYEVYICGIIKEKATNDFVSTKTGSLGYAPSLKKKYIEKCNNSKIALKQIENPEINVFTGKSYASEEREYSKDDLVVYLNNLMKESFKDDKTFEAGESLVSHMKSTILSDKQYFIDMIKDKVVMNLLLKKYNVSSLLELTDEQFEYEIFWLMCNTEKYGISFKRVLDDHFASSSFESNKKKIGIFDESTLSMVYIYCSTFIEKDYLINYINNYNDDPSHNSISYSDFIGMIMSSVSTIVSGVSYVLIGFVSVSLIVSSIMIGIVTYISVLERKKEIGILRAMGASKKDIYRVFNSETLIIGLISGLIGVCLTWIFDVPVNAIINSYVDIGQIASLPWWGALGLIFISIILTSLSGMIPSQIASNKDPVDCLRGE